MTERECKTCAHERALTDNDLRAEFHIYCKECCHRTPDNWQPKDKEADHETDTYKR